MTASAGMGPPTRDKRRNTSARESVYRKKRVGFDIREGDSEDVRILFGLYHRVMNQPLLFWSEPRDDSRAVVHALDGEAWAMVSHRNPCSGEPAQPIEESAGAFPRVITWSGWFAEVSEDARCTGLFPVDHHAWSKAGWTTCEAVLRKLAEPMADRGQALMLRPHARHVVSDTPGCLRMLDRIPALRLFIDVPSLLTPTMLPQAETHLERILTTLGRHPSAVAITAANVRTHPQDPDLLVACGLADGLIPTALLRQAIDQYAPANLPLAVLEQDGSTALEWWPARSHQTHGHKGSARA